MPDRHNQRSNPVPTWLRGLPLVLAGMLVWGLACSGCAPLEQSDCDQLLQDHQWQTVLDTCKDPYDRSSAYLALGGFDLITLYNQIQADGGSLTALGIIQAFGLTTSNVATKRHYLELAVQAVQNPQDSGQAFALLIASAMGMTVSSIEFLDNGQMGGTALDGTFTTGEGEAALGFGTTAKATNFTGQLATLSSGTLAGDLYLSGVVNGTPYVFACADIGVDAVWCDNNPTGSVQLNADTDTVTGASYGNGAGYQGSAQSTVSLQNANSVNLVLQITQFTLPFSLNPTQVPIVNAFTGSGDASHTFSIGLEGYLSNLQTAQVALTQAGSDQGTQNTLSDAIDGYIGQLDNGAQCLFSTTTLGGAASALNTAYAIYAAAIGTTANPMPSGSVSTTFFEGFNQISNLNLSTVGLSLPASVPASLSASLSASSFVFGQPNGGSVSTLGYRLLYPTTSTLVSFDPGHSTTRIDRTPTTFQQSFEAMLLAPNVSSARDGRVSYAELMCLGAGAPPTGVTASASGGKVSLSWNSVSNATSYTVYRSTSSGVTQTTAGAVKTPNATSPFTDSTVVSGTTYYYVVTSTNSDGEGGISRQASVTP